MRVATLIQQQFLPRELPKLPQWQIAAYYGPARAVGGDFYDFIEMRDGRIGIAVGDVTDKGVPAALVMARTHSILRAEASRSDSPGRDPGARQRAARAGDAGPDVRDLPVRHPRPRDRADRDGQCRPQPALHPDGRRRHRAAGDRACRSACMPDIRYEETEGVIEPGSNVLLYSDGLVEAHDPKQEMYGFPRLREEMSRRRRRQRAARPPARHAPPVHRPRLGAGGRHHARHPAPGIRRVR